MWNSLLIYGCGKVEAFIGALSDFLNPRLRNLLLPSTTTAHC